MKVKKLGVLDLLFGLGWLKVLVWIFFIVFVVAFFYSLGGYLSKSDEAERQMKYLSVNTENKSVQKISVKDSIRDRRETFIPGEERFYLQPFMLGECYTVEFGPTEWKISVYQRLDTDFENPFNPNDAGSKELTLLHDVKFSFKGDEKGWVYSVPDLDNHPGEQVFILVHNIGSKSSWVRLPKSCQKEGD